MSVPDGENGESHDDSERSKGPSAAGTVRSWAASPPASPSTTTRRPSTSSPAAPTAYELGSDGVAKVVDTADYRTRILVYRPADAARFNGTVLVEWLNVSGGVDGCPDWTFLHREAMREGYAWVGVSAQSVGVHGGPAIMETAGPMNLIEVDPERYGSLSHPGDTFSFDMYAQAGAVARGAEGTVLADLAVERVVAIGESQSAFRLTTYVNVVDPVTPVYDGFFVHARGGSGSPLDASGPVPRSVGTARALPRRPPRAGALLRGRDRPDGRSATSRRASPTTTSSGSGRWRAPRTPTSTRSWPGSSTAARCRSPSSPRRGSRRTRRSVSRSSTRSTPDRSTTCSRPRSRTSIGGCATARRRRRRRAWRCATTIRRSSSSTTTATRVAASAHRTSTCPIAVLSGIGQRRRPDRAHLWARPSRSAPSSSRRSTRARPTTSPGSTAATDAAVAAGWFLEADAAEIKAIAAELYPA